MSKKRIVRKKSKLEEEFSINKYKKSLEKAGISKKKCREIYNEIEPKLSHYFSSSELHHKTYKIILKHSKIYAANYDIKRAIYNLGPTGYPFEVLCAEMLKAKGYKTRVSVYKKGMFVKHEVDVVAERSDGNIFCECKFHNAKLHKNDIKIPLYVHSRFLDIQEANPKEKFVYALMSNTDFSVDAIKYSQGVGLLLFSMNYPVKNTFVDIIKKYKVYPISVLKSLKVRDRNTLLDKGIVVLKQLKDNDLEAIGLKKTERDKILQEVKVLTRPT